MLKSIRLLILLGVTVGALGMASGVDATCPFPLSITHKGAGDSGYFRIPERAGGREGPRIRFWLFGQYAAANSGSANQWSPGNEWVVSPGQMGGANTDPAAFTLYQANWAYAGIQGCPMSPEDRTVLEISAWHNEGSSNHYGYYLIASVKNGGDIFDFDTVSPPVVEARPIPVPQPASATAGSRAGTMNVSLSLADATSVGDAGAPNLIRGYELLYVNSPSEPTTSVPGGYAPVRSAADPNRPLGIVGYGTGSVAVSVPQPAASEATYFVAQVVYQDPTADLRSSAVSGHSAPVKAPQVADATDDNPPADEVTEAEEPADLSEPTDANVDELADAGEADLADGEVGRADSVADGARERPGRGTTSGTSTPANPGTTDSEAAAGESAALPETLVTNTVSLGSTAGTNRSTREEPGTARPDEVAPGSPGESAATEQARERAEERRAAFLAGVRADADEEGGASSPSETATEEASIDPLDTVQGSPASAAARVPGTLPSNVRSTNAQGVAGGPAPRATAGAPATGGGDADVAPGAGESEDMKSGPVQLASAGPAGEGGRGDANLPGSSQGDASYSKASDGPLSGWSPGGWGIADALALLLLAGLGTAVVLGRHGA